jgi:hypothetical protein
MDAHMRPRFEARSPLSSIEEAVRDLTDAYSDAECGCMARDFYGRQVEVRVHHDTRHTWSPQLKVWFDQGPDGAVRARGRFGPEASVWTMFMAGYAVSAMVTLTGLIVWTSQIGVKGGGQWGVLLILLGPLGALAVFALARVGRRLARDEMRVMFGVLSERLDVTARDED